MIFIESVLPNHIGRLKFLRRPLIFIEKCSLAWGISVWTGTLINKILGQYQSTLDAMHPLKRYCLMGILVWRRHQKYKIETSKRASGNDFCPWLLPVSCTAYFLKFFLGASCKAIWIFSKLKHLQSNFKRKILF